MLLSQSDAIFILKASFFLPFCSLFRQLPFRGRYLLFENVFETLAMQTSPCQEEWKTYWKNFSFYYHPFDRKQLKKILQYFPLKKLCTYFCEFVFFLFANLTIELKMFLFHFLWCLILLKMLVIFDVRMSLINHVLSIFESKRIDVFHLPLPRIDQKYFSYSQTCKPVSIRKISSTRTTIITDLWTCWKPYFIAVPDFN